MKLSNQSTTVLYDCMGEGGNEMTPKEALDKLSQIEFETGDYMNDDGYMMRIESTEMYDVLRKTLTELDELKKRDTAMEITQASRFTTDKKLYGMYACRNCHEVIPYLILNSKRIKPSFCPHCGQRLDWSEKE